MKNRFLLLVFAMLPIGLGAQAFNNQGLPFDYYYYNNSSSASWGDVDGDGDLDLFMTNGEIYQNNEFYLNDGRGGFTIIQNAITQKTEASFGSCFGDYDNDGDLDLFVANADYFTEDGAPNFLFRNNGNGVFIKVQEGAPVEDEDPSYACTWIDYDNDGWLDLFVVNAYNVPNRLYRNDGQGGFTRMTEGGIVTDANHNISCSWVDYDNDGDADLLTINPSAGLNEFYENQGDGSFVKRNTQEMGFSPMNYCRSSSWADFDGDGWMDVVLVDGTGNDRLYRNMGNGTFSELSTADFYTVGEFSGDGSVWGDFDNDGDPDLILMHHFGVPKEFHQNNGDGSFTRIVETNLNYNNDYITYALASADYDMDGRLDFVQTNRYTEGSSYGALNSIYRNTSEDCNGFVGIDLQGEASNRNGIGSRVFVYYEEAGASRMQKQELQCLTGGGYTAQSGMRLHFGLGLAERIDSIVVEWPSGIRTSWNEPEFNTHLILHENGALEVDDLLYQMRLTAIRDEACPGRISRLEVDNARTYVKWYSDQSPEVSISSGRVFYVPEMNETILYTAKDGCGREVSYEVAESYFESRLFPNPVTDKLYLNLATFRFAPSAHVVIFNAAGQWLWEENFQLEEGYNVREIDMSRFASGTYMVQIESACYSAIEKIVVVR
ncbi:MAG: VCBS repeat-containing protein [Saprospiraceae bacterium]|nr:VCBS repeat-containing protein [Saprospiraceae bacterium]